MSERDLPTTAGLAALALLVVAVVAAFVDANLAPAIGAVSLGGGVIAARAAISAGLRQRSGGWVVIGTGCAMWASAVVGWLVVGDAGRPGRVGAAALLLFSLATAFLAIGAGMVAVQGTTAVTRARSMVDALVASMALVMAVRVGLANWSGGPYVGLIGSVSLGFLSLNSSAAVLCAMAVRSRAEVLRLFLALALVTVADLGYLGAAVTGRVDLDAPAALFCAGLLMVASAATTASAASRSPVRATTVGEAHRSLEPFTRASLWRRAMVSTLVVIMAVGALLGEVLVEGQLGVTTAVLVIVVLTLMALSHALAHMERRRAIRRAESAMVELAESEEKFRVAFQDAPTGFVVADERGVLIDANRSFAEMMGVEQADLVGSSAFDLSLPDALDGDVDLFRSVVAGAETSGQIERRYRTRDGREVVGELSYSVIRKADGGTWLLGHIVDVTEQRRATERLEHMVRHDHLTGLLNRAGFVDDLEAVVRSGSDAALLFLDLDRFKEVNDSLGHDAGDQLLMEVAVRLVRTVGARGVVGRLGGDEFTVLIDGHRSSERAEEVAGDLIDALAEPIVISGVETFVTASVGIAHVGDEQRHRAAEMLLADADAAMYQAKERGRRQAVTFDPSIRDRTARRLRTANDLHRALDREELLLHYQPVVRLADRSVVGFEALVRWNHPEAGLLLPGHFMDVAEHTGLIVPIGNLVLHEATHQLARWEREGLMGGAQVASMAVNLSARQLVDTQVVESVETALEGSGLRPEQLVLEITESSLMADTSAAEQRLDALHRLGVKLAVDDFGTGYSSLTYLKRFPVDALKIDRSFVDGLGHDAEDTVIVEALVGLAASLGLECIAEGVETAEQGEFLRSLRCTYAQGFHLGRPLPADDVAALLAVPTMAR